MFTGLKCKEKDFHYYTSAPQGFSARKAHFAGRVETAFAYKPMFKPLQSIFTGLPSIRNRRILLNTFNLLY
jgi:hypothetical protein